MNLDALTAFRTDLHEYFCRADFLIKQGDKPEHSEWIKSMSIVSAIYALQAAFEVASRAVSFSGSDAEKTKRLKKEFLDFASGKVRYLYLLDALRSHDFHRHAIIFREGRMVNYGPIIHRVREAGESVSAFPDETGRLTIYRAKDGKDIAQPHHPKGVLQIHGFLILEPESGQWMHILKVLSEHGKDLVALLMSNPGSATGTPPDGFKEPMHEPPS